MIEVNNLTFEYGAQALFNGLNVGFEKGRIYGVLGKNGAGKTTLLKIICGLLKPKQGTSSVLGRSSLKKSPQLLKDIYFIPESYYLPPVTIEKYEKLHASFYDRFDSDLFGHYLKEMELDRKQMLNSLSYGLTKRFLLAFGLATNSRILLLDEPSNGLDIPSKRVFRKLLAGAITPDRTFIIATHQIKEMEALFDHLVFIDQGKMLLSKPIFEIAQKLRFKTVSTMEEVGRVLYKEEIPGGYAVIEKNESGEEYTVDIEFLFNAVTGSSNEVISELSL
ncbi:ABC transporter ATP-binding protein [bacterium]|nr:ABC transporter ATP-binding protein [bacterium]